MLSCSTTIIANRTGRPLCGRRGFLHVSAMRSYPLIHGYLRQGEIQETSLISVGKNARYNQKKPLPSPLTVYSLEDCLDCYCIYPEPDIRRVAHQSSDLRSLLTLKDLFFFFSPTFVAQTPSLRWLCSGNMNGM